MSLLALTQQHIFGDPYIIILAIVISVINVQSILSEYILCLHSILKIIEWIYNKDPKLMEFSI